MARLFVDNYPKIATDIISRFDLPPSDRFELAEKLAKMSDFVAWKLAKGIDHFQLSDENLSKLIRILIDHHPINFAEYLHEIKLSDEQRSDLTQVLIQKDPVYLVRNIDQFVLSDEQLNKLANILVEKKSSSRN